MRGAIGSAPGVASIDIQPGPDGFTVHYDSGKTDPQALLKLLHEVRPDAKVKA